MASKLHRDLELNRSAVRMCEAQFRKVADRLIAALAAGETVGFLASQLIACEHSLGICRRRLAKYEALNASANAA